MITPALRGYMMASDERVRLRLLGPVRAWRGDTPLELGPAKQRALLAALALSGGRPVAKRTLIGYLWGSRPPATAGNTVATYVLRLRAGLRAPGEAKEDTMLVTESGGYRLDTSRVDIDAPRLRRTAADADTARRAGDLDAAATAYADALELFDGEPLAGLPGPYAGEQRARLAEEHATLTRELLGCLLDLGRHTETVAELSALVAQRPYDEALAVLLMRALHASGRSTDALDVYEHLRRRLTVDKGREPGDGSRAAQRAILRGEAVAPASPARPGRPVPDELPADIGDLVGRDTELRELTAPSPGDAVTIRAVDGLPGAGKTALAVRAARRLRDRYPDGRLFLGLYGHTEGRAPLPVPWALRKLLNAMGAEHNDIGDDVDELAARWRTATASARLVLVLDDAAGAEQLRHLLPAGPGSLVLVTSRRRLPGLDAERRVSLGPLPTGAAEDLLGRIVGADRAGRETRAVADLARLCDRLPLALRIAGARLQSRPVWAVADLVRRLSDDHRRLGELAAENRSVAAAFALSHGQLGTSGQHLFGVLGWSPNSRFDPLFVSALLRSTPGDAEDVLEDLLDANLLQQQTAGMYRMHDLLRDYARQATGLTDAIAEAHGRGLRLYLAGFRKASDRDPDTYPTGPRDLAIPFADQDEATRWLDTMTDDIAEIVAHQASAAHRDLVCWIAEAAVDYFTRRGRYHECRVLIGIALPLADDTGDARMPSTLLNCMGTAYGMQGRYAESEEWFRRALDLARHGGHLREQAAALGALGTVARILGRDDEAAGYLTEVLDLAARLGDDWLTGMSLCNLGAIHQQHRRYPEALDCFDRAVAYAERIGAPRVIGKSLCYTAGLHLELGAHEKAAEQLDRAVEMADRAGDVSLRAFALTRLGTAKEGLGEYETAIGLHRRALDLITEQSAADQEAETRNRLGATLLAAGDRDAAREQYERVVGMTEDEAFGEYREAALAGLRACGE